MKIRIVLIMFIIVIGTLAYSGSHRKVLAQSSTQTQAIVNATGCTLAGGGSCSVTANWPGNFADNNYAPVCTAFVFDGGTPEGQVFVPVNSQSTGSVTVGIHNSDPFTVTTTVSCIGVHN
jgi:hypothetical protein